jgi:hypothetical protein
VLLALVTIKLSFARVGCHCRGQDADATADVDRQRWPAGLDQGLQAMAYKFGDEFTGSAAAMQLLELTGIRMRNGHGLVLRLQVVLKPGSQTGPPIAQQGI